MTANEVIKELKLLGNEPTKRTFMKHGAPEPFYGVKVGDMKPIVKKIKKDYALSIELYNSGISDAMYLAGLISDPEKMTEKDLQNWAENATWYMISEYAVAWTAAESKHALKLAEKWIKSKDEKIATCGWNTYSSYLSITADDKLDKAAIQVLLHKIEKEIHQSQNRVRHTMNGFLISVGGYVPSLRAEAIRIAKKIGGVEVDMGGTACKVPSAVEYIDKMVARGVENKKRKSAKC